MLIARQLVIFASAKNDATHFIPSFWDRIWVTFRLREEGRPVHFGLDEYDGKEWQRVSGLLSTPFQTVTLRGATD